MFERAFDEWLFSFDSIEEKSLATSKSWLTSLLSTSATGRDGGQKQTTLRCNFIDRDEFKPVNKFDAQA